MNYFLPHSLNWFLFPGSRFSFSNTLRSLLFWKRPPYDPRLFKLLSHFPPPFTAKYCVLPCLCDSLSHYSSAIWLSPPPPLSHGCVCGHPAPNSKDFSWFLSFLASWQWSVLLTVICSVESSLVLAWVQVCCAAASPSLWLLCPTPVQVPFLSFYSSVVGVEGGSLCKLLICLSTLTLWSPLGLGPYHYFSKCGSCIVLCTHLFILTHASCLLSFCVSAGLLLVSWGCYGLSDIGFLLLVLLNLHSSSSFFSFLKSSSLL